MKFKKKICQFCGDEFIPTSGVQKFCQKQHERQCPVCGKTYIEEITYNLNFPPHACSYECRGKLQSQTKALQPKKKSPLQIDCENFEGFEEKSIEAYLKFKGKTLTELQKLLDLANIHWISHYLVENQWYDLVLVEHNALITTASVGYERDKNLEKIKIANDHGFKCRIVYPWDDLNKIISEFTPITVLDDTQCQVYQLNRQPAVEFLDKYDLKGSCRNQLVFLGIVADDQILEVMTFGKARRSQQHHVELMRSCKHPKYHVKGGTKYLFEYALAYFMIDDIVAYSDKSKQNMVELYSHIDMKLIRTSPPQEIWFKDDKYITPNLLRMKGFDHLFGTNYGTNVNNNELMLKHGWFPIYDCGQDVFEFRKS